MGNEIKIDSICKNQDGKKVRVIFIETLSKVMGSYYRWLYLKYGKELEECSINDYFYVVRELEGKQDLDMYPVNYYSRLWDIVAISENDVVA